MTTFNLAIIGTGNMGTALLRGLIKKKIFPPERVIVWDVNKKRLKEIVSETGVAAASSSENAVRETEAVLLAVKPQDIKAVLGEIAEKHKKESLIISIAAGAKTTTIESALGEVPVVRVMPNTPALIGEGISCICAGCHTTSDHMSMARRILEAAGRVEEVPEKYMDAVTGLSGSGPAYVFDFIDALSLGGVKAGLPMDLSRKLAVFTTIGAANMIIETKENPSALRDRVTSPGGTTIAGLTILKERGFSGAIINAVEAAAKRSEELGR